MRYDYKNKSANVNIMNRYMLAKTSSMFEYSGLPVSIPSRELENQLQTHGFSFITEIDGELYALHGTLGGEQDVYGNPPTITVANTALQLSKTFDLNKDGVLIRNDDYNLGLLPLYNKYHTMLVENDINIIMFGYNSRSQMLISAPDDKTKDSAEVYVKKLIGGDIAVIGENYLFDGVRVQSTSTTGGVNSQQLTELHQYLKASLYNEVGISSNFNMKRERLISSELDQAEDSLFPLVYNMMQNRIDGIKQLNLRYGLTVDVDFGSIWHYKNKKLVDNVTDNGDLPDESRQENKPNQSSVESSSKSGSDSNEEEEGGQPEQLESNQGQDLEPELDGQKNPTPEDGQNLELDNSDSGNSSENSTTYTLDELQAIIDSDLSTPEDKQAAEELINELHNA